MSTPSGFVLSRAADVVALEDAGTVIPLRDETGTPMTYGKEQPVTMTVAGSYSAAYRKAESAFTQKLAKQKRSGVTVAEMLARRQMELTAACVLAWDGFTYDGDKPLPLSVENVIAVFEAAQWIYDQAVEAVNDHAGFSQRSSAA